MSSCSKRVGDAAAELLDLVSLLPLRVLEVFNVAVGPYNLAFQGLIAGVLLARLQASPLLGFL